MIGEPLLRWTQWALIGTIGALALSSCAQPAPTRQQPPPPAVQTAVAREGTLQPTLVLSGIVAPAQNVALSSSLSEPAASVLVQEGDRVRRGQVLAVLDTSDLQANLQYDLQNAASNQALTTQNVYSGQLSITQGQDQARQAEAALRQAQTTLANDERTLRRYQQLDAQGYITQQQVDTQQTTVNNDQQAVRNAQAAYTSAVANVSANGTMSRGLQAAKVAQARAEAGAALAQAEQTRTSIAKATIASPIDGVVVNRNLNPGEYPGSRQIFTLQETDVVYAILGASSADVFWIPKNAAVNVNVAGRPGTERGTVTAVLDQLTPGSTNFAVKVRVPNRSGALHSGMSVRATVALAPVRGITIPYTAFLDDNHNSVLVVQGDTVRTASVVQRATDGRSAVVAGLSAGSRVVTNGQSGLSDGQKVAVR
ncbi:MAG: efflux RND transporter periplasmic adaptor subunit [Candidatus Eremiobacteraeota bacterium]|nr:efflux RND transporter periplasmic adaptor subunit [Candidatus Eremiobacteraeota bacterium]